MAWILHLVFKITLHCFCTFLALSLLMFEWNRGTPCPASSLIILYPLCFCYMIILCYETFLTSISKFLYSVCLSFIDQLNVGCFKCGPYALASVLSTTFLLALHSAGFAASFIALTTALAASIAAWEITYITACTFAIFLPYGALFALLSLAFFSDTMSCYFSYWS